MLERGFKNVNNTELLILSSIVRGLAHDSLFIGCGEIKSLDWRVLKLHLTRTVYFEQWKDSLIQYPTDTVSRRLVSPDTVFIANVCE